MHAVSVISVLLIPTSHNSKETSRLTHADIPKKRRHIRTGRFNHSSVRRLPGYPNSAQINLLPRIRPLVFMGLLYRNRNKCKKTVQKLIPPKLPSVHRQFALQNAGVSNSSVDVIAETALSWQVDYHFRGNPSLIFLEKSGSFPMACALWLM